jgi:Nuf2 family
MTSLSFCLSNFNLLTFKKTVIFLEPTMDFTTTSSATTGFVFPILKSGDILQCMSELGIEMTEIELKEPARHKEKLKSVFVQLVRKWHWKSVYDRVCAWMDRLCHVY